MFLVSKKHYLSGKNSARFAATQVYAQNVSGNENKKYGEMDMKKILLLLLFPFYSFSQLEDNSEYKIATYNSATEEIYADIWRAENSYLIPYSENLWVRVDGIFCLSGIMPSKWDHQYSGISFKPTFEEISKWKNWFEQNKQNIKYSTEPEYFGRKVIVFEYEKGKFRRSDCVYPK